MKSEAASHFWSDSYEEERINPEPNQRWYLILSDLKRALDAFATNEALKILDFGCGGSPYRSLFPNSDYKRADVKQYPGVDFLIDDNGRIDVPDNRFDLVWSTQVAEHVHHPEAYFAEMYRLLKPGGRLVVSTHGSYEDHGCPHDYQRWTPWGLRRDLEKAGFHSDNAQFLVRQVFVSKFLNMG
jgi:SAM-dependent methyltransferase